MKPTFFENGKKAVFAQKIEYPSIGHFITLTWIFGINENVIWTHNNKYVKLFS